MREAPSRVIIAELLRLVDNQQEVLDGSDALVIITDWKEFKNPDFDAIKARLKQPVVIDGRNLYEPALMQTLGIEYIGIGRSAPT